MIKQRTKDSCLSIVSSIGEFRISKQGLTITIVDGYQGDANLQYFSSLGHSASVYHNW